MKPTKTPLLSELFFAYRESNPELFLNESKSANRLRNYLKEFLQDEEQEKQVVFSNTLGVYANEFYYMGYIDGFKVCKWLMEELELTRDKDFLKELLIEDQTMTGKNAENKITNDIESPICSEKQAAKDKKMGSAEDEGLDYEKIEKAALDSEKALATIGCLIAALHDHGGDDTSIKVGEDTFCWQLKAALEGVYDTLKDTSIVFFVVSDMIESERKAKKDAEDNGQDSV